MILEIVLLNVQPGRGAEYERAFERARPLLAASRGHRRHELRRCVETPDRFALLVWWDTLEDHEIGFRGSPAYQEWKAILHPFYEPFPPVEHYTSVVESE